MLIYINHYIMQFSIYEHTHTHTHTQCDFYFVYKITKDYNFLQRNLIKNIFYASIVEGSESWMSLLETNVSTN